jgi:hypothetical protein
VILEYWRHLIESGRRHKRKHRAQDAGEQERTEHIEVAEDKVLWSQLVYGYLIQASQSNDERGEIQTL